MAATNGDAEVPALASLGSRTPPPTFAELLTASTSQAVHLEMRDTYLPGDQAYLDWLRGEEIVPADRWPAWFETIGAAKARGVGVRRARIVSEPVTDYILHEWSITTGLNEAAGEEVRWLNRRYASDLALPGNDFWLFDDVLVRFHHFAGDGSVPAEDESFSTDPSAIARCQAAFESVWKRAVPHRDYEPAYEGLRPAR